MKRRVVGLLLVVSLIMTACGQSKPNDSQTEDVPAAAEAEETEEAENVFEVGGGSPWLDTNIKENVTEGMPVSANDDFYLYANYDWIMDSEIPPGYSSYSSFEEVMQEVQGKAQAVFDDENLEGHASELVRTLHSVCLDWDARNEQGMEPIMDVVKKIQDAGDIEAVSKIISDPEQDPFLPVFMVYDVDRGLDDSSAYIAMIGHDSFILRDAAEYKSRSATGNLYYEAYKKETAALLVRIGYEQDEAEKLFDAVIDLETRLAEVSFTSADQASPDYIGKINNVMTFSELSELTENYPMEGYIQANGLGAAKQFLVYEPEYIKRLDQIYTEENLDAIKGYILIKYLIINDGMLDKEAYDLSVERNNTIRGSSGQISDEEYAYNVVTNSLPEVMGQAYTEKYDCSKMKQDIKEICNEIIDAYRQILNGADWLSDETRKMALLKLDNIIVNAVYPDEWYDYSGLSLEGLSYMECAKTIRKFEIQRKLEKVDQKAERSDWSIDGILQPNAFYDPSNNSINIILGLLGGVYYGDDMTKEEMFGGIGYVIGHEISHAFDTTGAQFDENGNFANWWSEEDYTAFRERADKLVAYYDGITPFGNEKVIGNNIQGEAIADITSIQCLLSIAAGEENFDYNAFFIQAAMNFREIDTAQYSYFLLSQDVHPLNYLRVNTVLQQFDEFNNTYDIKPGDNMYLAEEDRILVW